MRIRGYTKEYQHSIRMSTFRWTRFRTEVVSVVPLSEELGVSAVSFVGLS
jgi:hypothetical protein